MNGSYRPHFFPPRTLPQRKGWAGFLDWLFPSRLTRDAKKPPRQPEGD